MKRVIYFSGVLLLMSFSAFAGDEQALDQVICATSVVEEDDFNNSDAQADLDFDLADISLEDLDDLERDPSLSWSEKTSMLLAFMSFQAAKAREIAGEKLAQATAQLKRAQEYATNHIAENKKAYALGGLVLGAASTLALVMYWKPELFFATPATP